MASWLSFLWYEAAYFLSAWGMTLGFSLRICGNHNVPPAGPALVIANHQSFLDPVLVALAMRRHLRGLARKTLFHHPIAGWLIRSVGGIPIDHHGVGKEGLKAVLAELARDRAVLIFPEGTRTREGAMHELKPGILLLLRRVQAPVVPVGLAGAFAAWPAWRHYPLPAPLFFPASDRCVAVAVGKPLAGARFAHLSREDALAELSAALRQAAAAAERLRRKPIPTGRQPHA
jgi:1-acyl-sn-glycerol-3-phosphate acyltransferase